MESWFICYNEIDDLFLSLRLNIQHKLADPDLQGIVFPPEPFILATVNQSKDN